MAAMLRAVEPTVLKVHGQQPFLFTTLGSRRRIPSVGYRRRRRRRVMAALSLRDGIAEFYDQSSGAWEHVWGDHMHHGFYDPGASASVSYHRSAQIRMIDEALKFAAVSGYDSNEAALNRNLLRWEEIWVQLSPPIRIMSSIVSIADDPLTKPKKIVDVGCGIGGSSRYLAKRYGAQCQGITLSSVQAQRAQALTAAEGLEDKVSFQVADALEQPFPDGQFDLVWSMESGEHMPDKTKFVSELARVAAPGATIIIVTWCHRDLSPSEDSLKQAEWAMLKRICDAYYLPSWCSAADYVKIAQSLSLEDVRSADWSDNVAPFWPAVIRSALSWKGFTSLLTSGWKTIRGALVMPLMIQGYKKKLIKFAIITCKKPKQTTLP